MKYNESLTTLNLKYVDIGYDGAAALGECLKYSKSLTTLILDSDSSCDDDGAALG